MITVSISGYGTADASIASENMSRAATATGATGELLSSSIHFPLSLHFHLIPYAGKLLSFSVPSTDMPRYLNFCQHSIFIPYTTELPSLFLILSCQLFVRKYLLPSKVRRLMNILRAINRQRHLIYCMGRTNKTANQSQQ